MIYSSITPYVHMLYTAEDESDHICLDFSNSRRRGQRNDMYGYDSFGVSVSAWYSLHNDTEHSPDARSGVSGSLPTVKRWLPVLEAG